MKLRISKDDRGFVVDPVGLTGSPRQGVGRTQLAALGDFLIAYQKRLGIDEIEVAESAQGAERARRKRAVNRR